MGAGRGEVVSSITQLEGHLIVAAIRVLAHRLERSPRPEEVADLIELAPAALRVKLVALAESGIVAVVESAFDTHVEIRDYHLLEDLPAVETDGDLSEDLADFDRRKREESERMDRLFGDREHEKRQAERMQKMDQELRDYRKKKPPNPFGDD